MVAFAPTTRPRLRRGDTITVYARLPERWHCTGEFLGMTYQADEWWILINQPPPDGLTMLLLEGVGRIDAEDRKSSELLTDTTR